MTGGWKKTLPCSSVACLVCPLQPDIPARGRFSEWWRMAGTGPAILKEGGTGTGTKKEL